MTRTLLVVGAAVAALGFAGTASAQSVNVGGSIAPVCTITNLVTTLSFPALTAGATQNDPFNFQCNDFDGARVRLTSGEGHLESIDIDDDNGIGYTANITTPVGVNFTLNATTGVNNIFAQDDSVSGSVALATGTTGNLLLTLTGGAIFAGGYGDTLQVDVSAL